LPTALPTDRMLAAGSLIVLSADLADADLYDADLTDADSCGADLSFTDSWNPT